MEAHQKDVLDVIVGEVGESVFHIVERSGNDRFFLGALEVPSEYTPYLGFNGIEISHYFHKQAIKLAKEILKQKITEEMGNSRRISVKASQSSEWYLYS